MKKFGRYFLAVMLLSIIALPGVAWAELGGAVARTETIDKNNLEGWITRVDYRSSEFRVLDPRGFQRIVRTKPGVIGDYRLGDKVKVQVDPERKIAAHIEKIR